MKRVLLCALLLAFSAEASAVVYKWVDPQGKLQYGDRPPDGIHAEVVEMPGSHATQPVKERPAATTPSSTAAATTPQPPAQNSNAKKAVEADVAQSREQQCSDAQDRYKKLIEGRRLYKAGADGERQYLTSEEIDSQRSTAKHQVDEICNSPT